LWPDQPYAPARGSFERPVLPPLVDPDTAPTLTVAVNCEWLPFIRGALMQLLLQATWTVSDPAELTLTQARVFSLIDLFQECGSSVVPFACPYDFTAGTGGWSLFPNSSGYVPSTRGVNVPFAGWQSTHEDYASGLGYCSAGIAINKTFTATNLRRVALKYTLAKGSFNGVGSENGGILLRSAGSIVGSQLVDMVTLPDTSDGLLVWEGDVTADEVILFGNCADNQPCSGSSDGLMYFFAAEIQGTGSFDGC
jgi:hypothetical protein